VISVDTAVTVGMLAWLGILIASIGYEIAAELRRTDRTIWWLLGAVWAWFGLLRRHPLRAVVVAVAALIALLLLGAIELPESGPERENRPPIAPIVADTLRMPGTCPFARTRPTWPPFLGHRLPLGGDRS
jgi:hypothetical protein